MSFRERGQFLSQRGEFVSHARGIDAGSYKLDENKFIIVSYTTHSNLGKSSVKAEILEPQTVKYPVNGRLWRGHSMSVDTGLLGHRRPAVYTVRHVLTGENSAIILDERQTVEPRVGYLSLSHFKEKLKEIKPGAESIGSKDIERIRDRVIPLSL